MLGSPHPDTLVPGGPEIDNIDHNSEGQRRLVATPRAAIYERGFMRSGAEGHGLEKAGKKSPGSGG